MRLTDKQVEDIRRRAALRTGAKPLYDMEVVFSPLPITATETEKKVHRDIQENITRVLAGKPAEPWGSFAEPDFKRVAEIKTQLANLPLPSRPDLDPETTKYYPSLPKFEKDVTRQYRKEFLEFGDGYIEAICRDIGQAINTVLEIINIDKAVFPKIAEDCRAYFNKHFDLLNPWPTPWKQKGSDFWYVRNHLKDTLTIAANAKDRKHYIENYGMELLEKTLTFGPHDLKPTRRHNRVCIVSPVKPTSKAS